MCKSDMASARPLSSLLTLPASSTASFPTTSQLPLCLERKTVERDLGRAINVLLDLIRGRPCGFALAEVAVLRSLRLEHLCPLASQRLPAPSRLLSRGTLIVEPSNSSGSALAGILTYRHRWTSFGRIGSDIAYACTI
jgi:hypothetical protein